MHLGTYFQIIRSIFPDSFITMKLLRFINYTYKIDSIKNMARQKRGTSSAKVNITGFEQNMPQGNNWQEFLKDSEYKDPLIEMMRQYVLEFVSGVLPRSSPFTIASRENEYSISPAENRCRHSSCVTWF